MANEYPPKRRTILAVSAQPDDAEFTCDGTLALWAGQGAEVGCVLCTNGSKGEGELSLSPGQRYVAPL